MVCPARLITCATLSWLSRRLFSRSTAVLILEPQILCVTPLPYHSSAFHRGRFSHLSLHQSLPFKPNLAASRIQQYSEHRRCLASVRATGNPELISPLRSTPALRTFFLPTTVASRKIHIIQPYNDCRLTLHALSAHVLPHLLLNQLPKEYRVQCPSIGAYSTCRKLPSSLQPM